VSDLLRWGAEDAPVVVVLVHGVMDRGSSFGRLGRRLGDAPGVAAVAYDRRGYDGAIDRGPGTLQDHADDLAEVVSGLDAERVAVFGHSFGGTVAWQAVASGLRPGVVVTYESPIPALPAYRDDLAAATLAVADGSGPAEAVEHFGRAMLGDANWSRLRPAFLRRRLAEGPAVVADLRALASVPAPAVPPGVRPVVGHGDSGNGYEAVLAGQLADLLHVEVVELPDAGHGVHLTHPDACSRWLLREVGRD